MTAEHPIVLRAEVRLLDQDAHRQRIAEALAAGIRAYAE